MKTLFALPLLSLSLFLLAPSAAFAGPQDFVLKNASSGPICYVYISPSRSNDWGGDVLGSEECLDSGESMEISFNGSSEPLWDVKVADTEGGEEVYTGFDLMSVSEITVKGGGKASYK